MSNINDTPITYVGGFPSGTIAHGKGISFVKDQSLLVSFTLAVELHRQAPEDWQVNQDVREVAFPPPENNQ